MNERLKHLRKHLSLNQGEMAERMNLSRSHISSLENGAREITDRIVHDVCREFNLNEHWFRTGEGDMFIQPDYFSLDEQAKKSNLTDLEIAIMRGYMELEQSTRSNIVSKLESIIQQQSETAATVDDEIEKELESYRRELKDEKKVQTLLTSEERKGLSG